MKLNRASGRLLAFLKRRYSTPAGLHSLEMPTFITQGRRATIFLGGDWQAGCELSRSLKNKGYTVTLRAMPLPSYEVTDRAGNESFGYDPEGGGGGC